MIDNFLKTDYHRTNGSCSILVVDDEPAFCRVMSELIESFGYHVRCAHNVEQAMQHIHTALPDLILTDVMMPGTDGLRFIRRLRSNPGFAAIPTIVVSARAEQQDIQATKRAGADACLVKPFSAQELRKTIHKFVPA